jgi:hypothetical protein
MTGRILFEQFTIIEPTFCPYGSTTQALSSDERFFFAVIRLHLNSAPYDHAADPRRRGPNRPNAILIGLEAGCPLRLRLQPVSIKIASTIRSPVLSRSSIRGA